ncbi:MAG: mechanosensitive ion channel [Phycisphaerae bacterium]|nr:mechanosensitive ion channel [Phycisphaerae bacterium]
MQAADVATTTIESQPERNALEVTEWLTVTMLEWSGKVMAVVLLMIFAWVLGAWARRAIGRLLERPTIDRTLSRFLGNAARWIIFVMAIVASLGFFGFNITSVAALVGAAGLTIGLALQGSLSNLAAGIMLLVLRPFKIGDVVQLAGQIGKVDDVDLFNTKIDTGDNRRLILPNGQIFGSTIENITHHPLRRCDVNVGTAYAADLRQARAALRRAGETIAKRDPARPVDVVLQNLGTHAIEWTVRVWVPTSEFIACRDQLLEAIKDSLDAEGISIPFPQQEVWFRNTLEKRATSV